MDICENRGDIIIVDYSFFSAGHAENVSFLHNIKSKLIIFVNFDFVLIIGYDTQVSVSLFNNI